MRFETLRDIDEAGHDVRIWCMACARGRTVDGAVWFTFQERGWPIAIDAAKAKFKCQRCRSSADVLIVPTRREADLEWVHQVERWFHSSRSRMKKLRRAK